jgi:hypothetical protein
MRVIKMCLSLFCTTYAVRFLCTLTTDIPTITLDCRVSLANYFFGLSSYRQEKHKLYQILRIICQISVKILCVANFSKNPKI